MASIFQMFPLIVRQNVGPQTLGRTPEPNRITNQADNVVQYDRVMETKLAISYAVAIETIYRARSNPFGGKALDVCCGPGHLSITMAKELRLDSLVGVDLSEPMVRIASANSASMGLPQVTFRVGDATRLTDFSDGQFDLTTMMDAAHHLPNLEMLAEVFRELDRVTAADGLVVVMDLVRLRTQAITERYIELLASDYVERGLPAFKQDFEDSMYAAWLPQEIRQSVPKNSARRWIHIVPRGLPFAQFIIGLPKHRKQILMSREPLWNSQNKIPLTGPNLADYKIAKMTMAGASQIEL